MKKILFMFLIFIVAGCCENKCSLIKEGEVVKVDYLQGNFGEDSKTIFYFSDGATQVLVGNYSIPTKKIKIYECKQCSTPLGIKIEAQ